jgi:hypothetical protein
MRPEVRAGRSQLFTLREPRRTYRNIIYLERLIAVINKKNLLGKEPELLGIKDAIHTAIVSVRAGCLIRPGQRCKIDKNREAVPDSSGYGVADPFLKGNVQRGKAFWLILNQDEVPNVQHVWEHPSVDFEPPTAPASTNRTIAETAKKFGVTYEQVMEAAAHVVEQNESAVYPGTLDAKALEAAKDSFERYDFWSEWADESGHEFENEGTACCPEYDYPYKDLFVLQATT